MPCVASRLEPFLLALMRGERGALAGERRGDIDIDF
jgi:hypothetical protein